MLKLIFACLLGFAVTTEAGANPKLVSGLNQFAFTSHQHLYQPNHSAVYSPYSIGVLLELLTNGSAGETRNELMHAFSLTSADTITTDIDALNLSLTKDKDVIISNAFWVDQHFSFNPTYMQSIKEMQTVSIHPVDFVRSGATVKNQINDWAEKSTRGYIKSLLSDPLSDNTKLVLTNAVYFKGLWALPFDNQQTRQETFTHSNGSKSMLAMMHRGEDFNYTENETLQMLILGYDHSNLAMALLLPKAGKILQDISSQMTSDQFKLMSEAALKSKQRVDVSVPKFKIESSFSDALQSALKMSGIREAFNSIKADFSNLTASGSTGLYISDTIQKAVIEVDEKGTVAAAASAVVVSFRSAMISTKPLQFRADHPFMFVIFDKVTGLILFMGEMQ